MSQQNREDEKKESLTMLYPFFDHLLSLSDPIICTHNIRICESLILQVNIHLNITSSTNVLRATPTVK